MTSGSGGLSRELPGKPSFARPVSVPEAKRGEPLITIAQRERAGRMSANRRIEQFGAWYDDVRRDYSRK